MANFNTWTVLGIITAVSFIIFWRKRSAVWGGLTIGAIIGLIVTTIYLFKGSGFNWVIIGKGAVLGTMAGFIAELLGKISDLIKKRG